MLCLGRRTRAKTFKIGFIAYRRETMLITLKPSYINYITLLLHSIKASIFWYAFWHTEKVTHLYKLIMLSTFLLPFSFVFCSLKSSLQKLSSVLNLEIMITIWCLTFNSFIYHTICYLLIPDYGSIHFMAVFSKENPIDMFDVPLKRIFLIFVNLVSSCICTFCSLLVS